MKIKINSFRGFCALSSMAILFTACQKDEMAASATEDVASSTITVAAVADVSGNAVSTDSVYLLQSCGRGGKRDSIAQSALPATVQTYVAANYAGATFHKAFAIKNSAATLTGYVVVVYYNEKPVGLEFDSTGAFVKVLEQREKGDLHGAGHYRGGRFEHRDGRQRDTIAINALPFAVTSYFATNYASDTLVKAVKSRDNSIVVLSKNNGVFATVFNADGSFATRQTLPAKPGAIQNIQLAALPSIAASYLSQTYPNYVFEKAFSVTQGGVVKGFLVLIDANNTKYAIEFDTSGNFLRGKTIH